MYHVVPVIPVTNCQYINQHCTYLLQWDLGLLTSYVSGASLGCMLTYLLSPPELEFSKEDMAKSLLHMISNDIGQLACLYARLHNLTRVYFGGFFIRGHPVTMHTITYSINFFTKASPPMYRLNKHFFLNPGFAFRYV